MARGVALRSDSEIAIIRKAGEITAAALEKLKTAIRIGVTTKELDAMVEREITARGGIPAFKGYRGYPATICASINDVVVHGIPSGRSLKDGDIISIDVGVGYKGYFADTAITLAVGRISQEARRLMDVTEQALYKGLENAGPGKRLSEISCAVQDHVEANGFSVVRAFVGHGIGTKIHEEPEVPNFGRRGTGMRMEKGMVLAVEPMVNAGGHEVEILDDGWTAVTKDGCLSAHFEHTIAITDAGFTVLTVL